MKLKIAILAGDGIGPEVTREAQTILNAVAEAGGHEFVFTRSADRRRGHHRARHAAAAGDHRRLPRLATPCCWARWATTSSTHLTPDKRPEAGLLQIRQVLGGFANLRPAVAYPALAENSPLRPEVTKGADILFVRELLGGLYFGQPRSGTRTTKRSHQHHALHRRDEVVRVARIAFELAGKRRKKLTSVDKANVLECSQLWRATVDSLKPEYPDVTVEHQLVDSMAMHLMNVPRNFDVVLTENLFGDILSDESGIITGSLGMLPSATIGGKVNLYEPVHGSAPDIAGTGKANPLGAILTAAMVLRHSGGLEEEAARDRGRRHPGPQRRTPHRRHRPRQHGRHRHHATDGQARAQRTRRVHRPPAVTARRLVLASLVVILAGDLLSLAPPKDTIAMSTNTTPRTLFEKVWQQHVVAEPARRADDPLHRPATGPRGHVAAGV